jgi:hypothetical protein
MPKTIRRVPKVKARDPLQVLRDVQQALACMRDGKPYIHPEHGVLTLEEVKYTIVDPAIEGAEG